MARPLKLYLLLRNRYYVLEVLKMKMVLGGFLKDWSNSSFRAIGFPVKLKQESLSGRNTEYVTNFVVFDMQHRVLSPALVYGERSLQLCSPIKLEGNRGFVKFEGLFSFLLGVFW